MPLDRFVYFNNVPSQNEIIKLIKQFVGDSAQIEVKDRIYINFGISCSSPNENRLLHPERFIEVFIHDDSIDVITRNQDEFVDCLAKRLSLLFAEHFDGKQDLSEI